MLLREGILAVLAAVFAMTAGQQIVVQPTGDSHTKPIGGNILYTCSATGLGNPTDDADLRWYNKEDQEITEIEGRIHIERAGTQALKLYITNIRNEDGGTYTCRGVLNGIDREKIVNLEIFKDITFDHAPSPQFLQIYTNALIICKVSAQPEPVVSWRHKGETLQSGGHYMIENDGLRILNLTLEDDDAVYLCRADVPAEGNTAQREINIEVHIPPVIDTPMGTQEGIAGQETSLTCEASGHPAPKYQFFKDNNENPVEGTDRITVDTFAGVIHFRPLIKGDEGAYRCEALNDIGDDEDTGFLKVLVPPKIETLLNQTAEEGQSQVLTCIAAGDPPPSMNFQKVGNPEPYEIGDNEGGKVVLVNPSSGRLEMTIKNLIPEDTANYTCMAVNIAGDHKQNGTMIVHYEPRFDDNHPTEFYLWAGKTRNITCFSQSEPEPVIRWHKDGNELVNNETYRIYNMKKNSNLQITCREEDQGWIYGSYRCQAINNIGTGDIELDVKRAALPGPPISASVLEASPTMLVMSVEQPEDNGGIPVFGYRFEYENNQRDVSLGDEIKIENLNPGTLYLFRIRARNEVGAGQALDFSHNTPLIRKPYPLEIQPVEPEDAFEYTVFWDKPKTGGTPIDEYEFKIRKVTVTDSGNFDKPLEDWVRSKRNDDPSNPMRSRRFENLSPDSYYQVAIRARNDIGYSDPNSEFIFHTQEAPSYRPVGGSRGCHQGEPLVVVCLVLWCMLGLAA